ncbi:MAG: helix-turn-helix domain-containing protein [Aldersonia sp.]|nr:helix-turn-helix domain-containing protein [Aldersonia sp.]
MSADQVSLSGRQPKAVQSALRVLEEVARAGVGVSAKDIAANLSIPSATTYRLLNILVAEGYVVRLPDLSGFALGRKVAAIVDAAVAPSVCQAARDVLAELRLTVRFGVHLFFFTNTAVRRADVDPEYPPPVEDAVVNAHLYASAVGKLLLAEKRDIEPLLGTGRPLTARTVVSRSELDRALAQIREQGFASQAGELLDGTACVAVPIRRPSGELVAALALTGHVDHAEILSRHVTSLGEYAAKLTPLLV